MAGTERPSFSVVQAALRTGKARSTIQRYLKKGAFPNARRDPDGTWQIPIGDLLGAGFKVDAPTPADEMDHGHAPGTAERVAALEAQLAQALARATAAEQVAAERERTIEVQANALRMLTAGTMPPPAPAQRQRGLLGRIVDNLGL